MNKYNLNQLYFAVYKDKPLIIALIEHNNTTAYVDVLTGNNYNIFETNIIEKFDQTLRKNGLEILIIDNEGRKKQFVTSDEISNLLKIINRNKMIPKTIIQKSEDLTKKTIFILCSLLGLNQTDIIEEYITVAITAIKKNKFENIMSEYIKINLLTKKSVSINGINDPIISKILNVCKINKKYLNDFSLEVFLNGNIIVNGRPITRTSEIKQFIKKPLIES